jgi:hypothetical protein
MVNILIKDNQLIVQLSFLEHLGAFSRNITLPASQLASVKVSLNPWSELRGVRCPGTGLPRVIMLGTCRFKGGKDFAAVYLKRPAVVVQLQAEAPWSRFVLCTAHPEADAETLREATGKKAWGGSKDN